MALSKVIISGLEQDGVYIIDPPSDGLPVELDTMDFIGEIVPDSVTPDNEDDTEVQIKAQETGEVLANLIQEKGAKRIKFDTYNFKTDNLLLALGGSVDSTGTWSAPTSTYRGILKAVAFASRADEETNLHTVVHFPKTQLKGSDEGIRQEGDASKLQFTATVYQPEDTSGNAKPQKVIQFMPTAPTNGVVDDTANTFAWDVVPAYPTAAEYEYSTDSGSSWTDCSANPQTGITGTVAAGAMKVRVKGTANFRHGFSLASTEGFTT